MIDSITRLRDLRYSNIIGEIITWDIQIKDIPVSKIRQSLDKSGIGAKALKDLQIRSIFTRAMKKLKDGRLLDEIDRDGDVIKFQLTRKERRSECIDHYYDCILTLNVETGEIKSEDNPELAKEAESLFAVVGAVRNGSDLSRLVQKLFESRADLFSINPRKGVAYFVPVAHREFADKVTNFFRECGGVMERFPVPDDGKGNASVSQAIDYGLAEMGAELEQSIREWDESTRPSTKKKAEEKIAELRFKHQCYAEYLGSKQNAATEQLKSLTQLMLEIGSETKEETKELETAE